MHLIFITNNSTTNCTTNTSFKEKPITIGGVNNTARLFENREELFETDVKIDQRPKCAYRGKFLNRVLSKIKEISW